MILLASRSPQRRALLAQLGIDFRVVASAYDEQDDGVDAGSVVIANALGKAREVARRSGVPAGGAVLGADTEVVLDGRVLGKPATASEARAMLAALAGRTHHVVTGMALLGAAGETTACETTAVEIRTLGRREIEWYIATGEWRERAGGYAIQGAGAALCRRIDGDPANVIGLPLGALAGLLAARGLWPPAPAAG